MQNLKRSFQILLSAKTVWKFGILLVLCSFLYSPLDTIIQIIGRPLWVISLYLIFILSTGIVYASINGSLIYNVRQASLNKLPSFSEAWEKVKASVIKILAVLFLWQAVPLLAGLCSTLIRSGITNREILIPMTWIINLVANVFYNPCLIFVLCAITVDKRGIFSALQTGILLTFKKFSRLLLVMVAIASIRVLADALLLEFFTPVAFKTDAAISSLLFPTIGGNRILMAIPSLGIAGFIITMFAVPWMVVFFTLEYIKSTEELVFPPLAT
jgi:hypothetical protein